MSRAVFPASTFMEVDCCDEVMIPNDNPNKFQTQMNEVCIGHRRKYKFETSKLALGMHRPQRGNENNQNAFKFQSRAREYIKYELVQKEFTEPDLLKKGPSKPELVRESPPRSQSSSELPSPDPSLKF